MAGRRKGTGEGEALAPAALRQKAIRLLARRERSRLEMSALLEPYCDDPAALGVLLDDLQCRGWLSEARLAAQLVRVRRPRASATRIRQELTRRGIDAEEIAMSTAGLEATDFEAAAALWRRRFGQPPADRAQRERQLRFLLNRGFGHAIALRVLRAAADEDSESP